MAQDRQTEARVIELRAIGKSYSTIAKEVGIAKQTAVDICSRNREELATMEAFEIERLHEEQMITYSERITALSSMMRKVREELETRDLSQVPTDKLIDIYLKEASALKEEMIEPLFKTTKEQKADKVFRESIGI